MEVEEVPPSPQRTRLRREGPLSVVVGLEEDSEGLGEATVAAGCVVLV